MSNRTIEERVVSNVPHGGHVKEAIVRVQPWERGLCILCNQHAKRKGYKVCAICLEGLREEKCL